MFQWKRLGQWILCVAMAMCVCLGADEASAEQMAGLKFETEGLEAHLKSELESATDSAFGSVNRWSLIDFASARSKMNPITRDCFTRDCLTKIGKAVNAAAGLSVELSGEAEIYEWTIEIWDLRTGEKLNSKEGTCELCGRAEVERTFESSVKSVLVATALPSAPTTETKPSRDDSAQPESSDHAGVALKISAVPTDTAIYINDQKVADGEIERVVGPGTHEVRFKREGYRSIKETVIINEHSKAPVVLRVHLSRANPEAVRVPGGEGPIDRLGPQRTTYGMIAAASGVGLLATGIYLTAIDGETACGDDVLDHECEEIYATGGAGMTMSIVGTALITGGVTLLSWELLAGKNEETPAAGSTDEPATMSLSPSVGANGAGVLLRGEF